MKGGIVQRAPRNRILEGTGGRTAHSSFGSNLSGRGGTKEYSWPHISNVFRDCLSLSRRKKKGPSEGGRKKWISGQFVYGSC